MFGAGAGKNIMGGGSNTALGLNAGENITSGSGNVAIGKGVAVASATGNCQFIIGFDSNSWITGDSSFNVVLAGIATVTKSGGIFAATKFCGDGSCLTNLPGFSADSQENLYAGTLAGAASDADTCFNIALGYYAGNDLN